jgi:TIR domain
MLAGEAGRIPTVVDFVRRLSGKNPLPLVEEAIAAGAAIFAARTDDAFLRAHPQESPQALLKLPSEDTPIRIVDTLVVNRGSASSRIELCVGDLTTLKARDAVDVLVVSAFPDSYTPLPGSLIGALARKGVNVEELARRKEVNLRQSFSCWMSPRLVDLPPGIHFSRILCFEPHVRGTPAELVGDIFRSLSPFVGENPPIRTVATPIPASGYQGVNPEKMLRLLVQAAVQWMAVGMPLSRLKICCLPGPNVEALQNAFQDVKRTCAAQAAASMDTFRYEIFLSYAHSDLNEVSIFERKLKEAMPGLRLFIDRKELNAGTAWQHEIYESLDDCQKVVALLTPAYLGSKVCIEEFNIALCRNREASYQILLPVYLYSARLPTYMKVMQFFDCRECEPARIDELCKTLSHELSNET